MKNKDLVDARRLLALTVYLPYLNSKFTLEKSFSFMDPLLIGDALLTAVLRSSAGFHTPSFTSLT